MLSLNQLEVLVTVVDCGGFSGAAKALYMSQPSVSSHVRNLENSLGVQLRGADAAGRSSDTGGGGGGRPCPPAVRAARVARPQRRPVPGSAAPGGWWWPGPPPSAPTCCRGSSPTSPSTRPNVACQIRVGNEETVEGWLVRGEVAPRALHRAPRWTSTSSPSRCFEEEMGLVCGAGLAGAGRPLRHPDAAGRPAVPDARGGVGDPAPAGAGAAARGVWPTRDRWDLWGPRHPEGGRPAEGLGIALLSRARHPLASWRIGLLAQVDVDPSPPSRTVVARPARRPDPHPARAGVRRPGAGRCATWPA